MPRIKCPSCGGSVSARATSCWQCGQPIEGPLPSDAPSESPPSDGATTQYARFVPRLHALCVDALMFFYVSMVVSTLFALFQDIEQVRVGVAVAWFSIVFLYEPVLVWRRGGTIGHSRVNLRVVDDRTGGNLSLPKAFVRFWLKSVLGLPSFLSMTMSARHQALHDLLTGSSVRVRDAAVAHTGDFVIGNA